MKKNIILILASLFLLFSCNLNQESKGKVETKEEKKVRIMKQISLFVSANTAADHKAQIQPHYEKIEYVLKQVDENGSVLKELEHDKKIDLHIIKGLIQPFTELCNQIKSLRTPSIELLNFVREFKYDLSKEEYEQIKHLSEDIKSRRGHIIEIMQKVRNAAFLGKILGKVLDLPFDLPVPVYSVDNNDNFIESTNNNTFKPFSMEQVPQGLFDNIWKWIKGAVETIKETALSIFNYVKEFAINTLLPTEAIFAFIMGTWGAIDGEFITA